MPRMLQQQMSGQLFQNPGKLLKLQIEYVPRRLSYKKEGIKAIVNVSEFDNRQDIPEGFSYYHINVADYGVPTDNQINKFLDISDDHETKKEPVVVHCVAGCGRTGQFIVVWGAYNGIIPKSMDPVKWIRNYRRCSLETKEQMSYARKVAFKFKKQ